MWSDLGVNLVSEFGQLEFQYFINIFPKEDLQW